MIIIEGKNVPTGEGVTVRPMTLDDCIEWRNDLVDLSDAEELLDILIAEIVRLNEPDQQRQRREQVARAHGFEELTPEQRAENRLANLGVVDGTDAFGLSAEPAPSGPIPMLLEGVRDAVNTLDPDDFKEQP
jgi:hypothetical protein